MERPGFLDRPRRPAVRDRLPSVTGGRNGLDLAAGAHTAEQPRARRARRRAGQARAEVARRARGGRPARAGRGPGPARLRHQVVYSSICAPLFAIADPELRYGAYRAHNRAMAEFCADDPRLTAWRSATSTTSTGSLGRARPRRFALGPRRRVDPGARARRACAGTHRPRPVLGAAGRAGRAVRAPRRQRAAADRRRVDGRRPPARRATSGAEIIGAKDFVVVHQPAERFLDGAGPGRRAGAPPARCAAGRSRWAPVGARDARPPRPRAWASGAGPSRAWATFQRRPSEQAGAQLRFTPYPFEDVGALCATSRSRGCTCSPPTTRTPRAAATRWGASPARSRAPAATVVDGFFAANAADWLDRV